MNAIFYSNNRKIFRLYCYLVAFSLLTFALRSFYDKYLNNEIFLLRLREKNLKSVHLLTGRFAFPNWELDQLGEEPFRNCPEKRCYAFGSLPFVHRALEESDGVMVHGPNLWYMPNRRTYKRRAKQIWLFYTMESQGLTFCSSHFRLADLDDWFNETATFKQSSSLPLDYKQFRTWDDVVYDLDYIREFKLSRLHLLPQPGSSIEDLDMKNRETFIVWYVSHCETYSRREEYVREMLKYLNIDIYGKCGSYFPMHAQKDPCKSHRDAACVAQLMNKYKFYLSFENCLCNDYITEKFWKLYDSNKIFRMNIVPVVKGARQEQYNASVKFDKFFINADSYPSPKDLAHHLIYLNENNNAYLEYFDWKTNMYKRIKSAIEYENEKIRKNWNVSTYYHLRAPFCHICSLLNNNTYLENSSTNKRWKLSEWFNKKIDCWDKDEQRVFLYKIAKFFGYCF